MLLADLPIVYHYKTKSYESFMRLQSGAGWKQYFQTGEFQGPKRHRDNKTELVVQNYMARNQTGSGVHDTSASRYASMLQRMRNTSLDERVPRYHPSRHCVLGYYGAGQLHCRRYFLTFMALVTSGQEKLLDDWISFHTALGVDHFAFLNVLNDSSVELALQKYVAHGIAELRGNRPTQDRLGTWKADWLAECAAGHCSFWVGYADLDEYLAPPRSVANLSSFLHPYTKRRNDTVFQKEPKQFQLMQKVFGSGRWYSDPPAGMPDIVAFTERGKELDWNGKSVALVDAVDLPQNKELVNFPHRFGLKAEVFEYSQGDMWMGLLEWVTKEGLLEVRQKNYILSARLFVHLMAGTLLLLLKISVQTPIRENWLSLLLPSMVYLQHLLVGSGLLQPGRSQVRRYALMNYFEFAAILVLDRALQVPDSVITEKFVLANRFVLSMVFMDTQLTAGGQLLFFLGNVGLNWYSGGPSLGMNLFEELQLWSATVGLSAILEFLVCARLRAALDAAQHEALLGSVQRILRGVCDGAVLLDDEHREALMVLWGESLMYRQSGGSACKGLPFDKFEHQRFQDFLHRDLDGEGPDEPSSAPRCLRASMRSSMDTRVGADIFHVPVPWLNGAQRPYHLLAIREDVESREVPEADASLPLPRGLASPTAAPRGRRSSASSRSSATSVHWAMPELSQVMLMVDTATPQLEVEQAHLSFLRAGKSLAALRELVRPTEWETVRGEIEHYLLGHEEAKEPLHLRPLRFRMSEGSKDYMHRISWTLRHGLGGAMAYRREDARLRREAELLEEELLETQRRSREAEEARQEALVLEQRKAQELRDEAAAALRVQQERAAEEVVEARRRRAAEELRREEASAERRKSISQLVAACSQAAARAERLRRQLANAERRQQLEVQALEAQAHLESRRWAQEQQLKRAQIQVLRAEGRRRAQVATERERREMAEERLERLRRAVREELGEVEP
eukprot:g15557.t1